MPRIKNTSMTPAPPGFWGKYSPNRWLSYARRPWYSWAEGVTKKITAISPDKLTGLVLWQDFTDATKLSQDTAGSTPVALNNDPIGRVVDKSSSANNFTQATSTKRPLWQSDGSGALFDGVDDVLAGATTNLLIASKTIILVWTPITFPASTRCAFGASNGHHYYVGHSGATADMRASWYNSTPAQKAQTSAASFTANNQATYATLFDVNGANVRVVQLANNTEKLNTLYTDGYATPTPSAFYTGALTAAGGNGVNAKIKHVLVYNRVLSSSELAALQLYLIPT